MSEIEKLAQELIELNLYERQLTCNMENEINKFGSFSCDWNSAIRDTQARREQVKLLLGMGE